MLWGREGVITYNYHLDIWSAGWCGEQASEPVCYTRVNQPEQHKQTPNTRVIFPLYLQRSVRTKLENYSEFISHNEHRHYSRLP